jgi:hypothetical protein
MDANLAKTYLPQGATELPFFSKVDLSKYSSLLPNGYQAQYLDPISYGIFDPVSNTSKGKAFFNAQDAIANLAYNTGAYLGSATPAGYTYGTEDKPVPYGIPVPYAAQPEYYSHGAVSEPTKLMNIPKHWLTGNPMFDEGDSIANYQTDKFGSNEDLWDTLMKTGHLTVDDKVGYGISPLQYDFALRQMIDPDKNFSGTAFEPMDHTRGRLFVDAADGNYSGKYTAKGENALVGNSTPVFDNQGNLTGYNFDVTPLEQGAAGYKNPNAQAGSDKSGGTQHSTFLARQYLDSMKGKVVPNNDGTVFVPLANVNDVGYDIMTGNKLMEAEKAGLGGILKPALGLAGMAFGIPALGALAGIASGNPLSAISGMVGANGGWGSLFGGAGDALGGAADFFGEGTAGAIADFGAGAAGGGMGWGDLFGDWTNFDPSIASPEDWGDLGGDLGDWFGGAADTAGTLFSPNDFANSWIQSASAASPSDWFGDITGQLNNLVSSGQITQAEANTALGAYNDAATMSGLYSTAASSPLSAAGKLWKMLTGSDATSGTGLSGLFAGGLSALGGVLSGNAAQDAANTTANAQLEAARIAAEAAKFKPVGVSTRFGDANWIRDANGNVTRVDYTAKPDIASQRDTLITGANSMLPQYAGSLAATAPMSDAAGRMMSLGNQYLATDPQAQAAKYLSEQQALLAPYRERERLALENRLLSQGRLGLATGGTSTGLNAANPEMEALYNAQKMQDLQLAANATQGGMDYAKFGSGMVGGGGDMLRSMYGTQAASTEPWKAGMSGAQYLEGLAQQPVTDGR